MTLDKYRGLADRMLGPFVSGAKRLGVSPDGGERRRVVAAAAAAVVFYLAGSDPVLLPGRRSARLRQRLARPGRRRACAELDVSSSAGDLLDHVPTGTPTSSSW